MVEKLHRVPFPPLLTILCEHCVWLTKELTKATLLIDHQTLLGDYTHHITSPSQCTFTSPTQWSYGNDGSTEASNVLLF
jgi:hypothetical protein